jgi:uncharacterized protein YbjT (DUF2867 family)
MVLGTPSVIHFSAISVHIEWRIFPEYVGGGDQDMVRHRARRQCLAVKQTQGERQHVVTVAVHVVGDRAEHHAAAVIGVDLLLLAGAAVMCGPDDAFLTTVVRLLRILPVYPMFGQGETRLQPVYVEDVAEGIARVLCGAGSVASYEFAGARVYTYKELVRIVADRIRARPRLVPLTFALWRILASGAEFLPGSPLTRNQVALMQRDNIASADSPGLSRLDIAPTEIENLISLVMDRS